MISEDTYKLLKKRKKDNESFSDVIKRLASEKGSIHGLLDLAKSNDFSPISDETAKNIEKASNGMRWDLKLRNVEL